MEMNCEKISFTIVTYNNEKIIKDTLTSLVNSLPSDLKYKIYIVDNCSTDETLKMVKQVQGNIEILVQTDNKGFGLGHNVVLDILASEYHVIVNPDILIEDSNQIIKMINHMDKNLEIGMMSPLILNQDMSIQYLCKKDPTVFDMFIRRVSSNLFPKRQNDYILKDTGYNRIMDLEYASGCFMFFRTSIFKEIKGFDPDFFMYLEDADITRRAREISRVIFYPEARIIHIWERSAYKSFKYVWITVQSMVVYFKKWGWKLF